MQLFYGVPEDIEKWMNLVAQVRWNFPGLETQEALDVHQATVLQFMRKRQAICVKDGKEIAGVMLFSREQNMICCLAVAPEFRRCGVASMLMDEVLANLDRTKEISVSTFRAEEERGAAPRALYEKYGFAADALIEEFGCPSQKYILHPAGAERKERQCAVNEIFRKIGSLGKDRITYEQATACDIEHIYRLCKQLIDDYEDMDSIDYDRVLKWVHRKIEASIEEYTAVYAAHKKVGYFHFYQNEAGEYEIDDLYIFPECQNQGIGSAVIQSCVLSVNAPVMLYVFIKNEKAVALYKRLGFEIMRTVNGSRYIMRKENRKYYEAYEERYKTAHAAGVSWADNVSTPIVADTLKKHQIRQQCRLLEIGCGEGRDSKAVLNGGYDLVATDISKEAIAYCQRQMPQYARHFRVLDCLSDALDEEFDFIYAVAVIHMLVLDEDRHGFYRFIRNHLKENGIALICTMGDGELETQSDITQAFTPQERNHVSGKMMVAGTSCRMVSWDTFEKEIAHSSLTLVEKGMTSALPNFSCLMYAVVKRESV